MESDESTRFSGGKTFLHGAIFMCNRKTKRECFQRKLFGLPPSMKEIVRSIRPGTTLFLFEYEERKMYGVFEATSYGALNIVPNAFRSSGKFFSAQVYFKELWNCHPLVEDEFSAAILDNYYIPRKFSLDLSPGQVDNLLKLFIPRIIRTSNRLCSVSSRTAVADSKNTALRRSKPMRLQKLIGQQQSLEHESLYPTIADSSYTEPALDNDDYFARNDVLLYPNLEKIDDFPDIDSLYSEDTIYLPLQGNVPLMGRRILLPNPRHSPSLHMVGGFQQEGLPSIARVNFPPQDVNDIPRSIRPLSEEELYKSQIDAGSTDSAGYLSIDSYGSLEVYRGRTILNEGLTNHLPSSSSTRSNAEALRNAHQQCAFDPYTLSASNCQQELGNDACVQKVGINPANTISGAYYYPRQLLMSDDGSSPLQYEDPGTLNFPETKVDGNILLSSPLQLNQWDEHCDHTAEHDDRYDDMNQKMVFQTCYHKCPAKHCKKGRERKKSSVFARISNAPVVEEQDSDEKTSLKQVQIHLSKLNPSRKSPCAESSFAAVGKKKFGIAPACEKKGSSVAVGKKQACSNVDSCARQCPVSLVQEQMHPVTKVDPSQDSSTKVEPIQDSSTKIDGLSGKGDDAVEAFSVREFINFKRRSVVRRDGPCVDGESSKSSLGKVKRRKLIRPTFSNGFVENTSCGRSECRNGQEELRDSMLGGEASVEVANRPMGNYTQDDAKDYVGARTAEADIAGQGEVSAELANRSLSIGHHSSQDDVETDIACIGIHKAEIIKTTAKARVQAEDDIAGQGEVSAKVANLSLPIGHHSSQDAAETDVACTGIHKDDIIKATAKARVQAEDDIAGQGEVSAELANQSLPIGHHSSQDDVETYIACTGIHKDDINKTSAKARVQASLQSASEMEVGLPDEQIVDTASTFPLQNIEERIINFEDYSCREKIIEVCKKSLEINEGIPTGSSNMESKVGIQMIPESDCSFQGREVPQDNIVDHEVTGSALESFFQAKHACSGKRISPIAGDQPRSLWENPEDPQEMYSAGAACCVGGKSPEDSQQFCSVGAGCRVPVLIVENNIIASGTSEDFIPLSGSLDVDFPASVKEPKEEDAAHCIISVAVAHRDTASAKP